MVTLKKAKEADARWLADEIDDIGFSEHRPRKPMKSNDPNLSESDKFRKLADEFDRYELEMEKYNELKKEHNKYVANLKLIMIDSTVDEIFPLDFPIELAYRAFDHVRESSDNLVQAYEKLEEISDLLIDCWKTK